MNRIIDVLRFAVDPNQVKDNMKTVTENTNTLIEKEKSVDLKVYKYKTKMMKLLLNED